MPTRTAVIWDELQADIKFFVVDEDWSKFDGVYINTAYPHLEYTDEEIEELAEELVQLLYSQDGEFQFQQTFVNIEKFVEAIHDGATVIRCGFVP